MDGIDLGSTVTKQIIAYVDGDLMRIWKDILYIYIKANYIQFKIGMRCKQKQDETHEPECWHVC